MQFSALIGLVWHTVLGLWANEEVADDEKMTSLPTPTTPIVVYSTVTEPLYSMPALFSLSSIFSLISMLVISIIYLSNLPDRLFTTASLSYYRGLGRRQSEKLQTLIAQHLVDATQIERLEIAVAQHLESLRLATEQHEAQLRTERQNHQAEIGSLKSEHARQLEHLHQTHAKQVEHLHQTNAKATELQAAREAQASDNHRIAQDALLKKLRESQNACRTADSKFEELEVRSDHHIKLLEKHIEVVEARERRAQHELSMEKFVGEDEWKKLREEKRLAEGDAFAAKIETEHSNDHRREVIAMYIAQSEDLAAAISTEGTATQKVKELGVEVTQKEAELVETRERNGALEASILQVQANLAERDQQLSKAEEENTRAKQKLERLKKKLPRVQVTATGQELQDAKAQIDKLKAELTDKDSQITKTTDDLRVSNDSLTASKLETATISAQLNKVKVELAGEQESSSAERSALKTAKAELSVLKGASARVYLANQTIDTIRKDLTTANADLAKSQAELLDCKANLVSSDANLKSSQAELDKVKSDLEISKAAVWNHQATAVQTKADLTNGQVELDRTKTLLGNTQAELAQQKATLMDTQTDLENTKAELLGVKAHKVSCDATIRKYEFLGKKLEAQVANLTQANDGLMQEVNSLKRDVQTAREEATLMRQTQDHDTTMSAGQAENAKMPATTDEQDRTCSEDAAMSDANQTSENVWPETSGQDSQGSVKDDQEMKDQVTWETHSGTIPGVPSSSRELNNLDLELLGEQPETSNVPIASSDYAFNFMAPQNTVWPPSNSENAVDESEEARPAEVLTEVDDTARLIEEALGNGLPDLDRLPEPVPVTSQAGSELIYGDYLPATQSTPQQPLSGLLYGARSQAPTEETSLSAVPSMPAAPHMERSSELRIQGSSHGASQQASSKPVAHPVEPRTSDSSGAVFDHALMSLNEWTPPQEDQTQAAMARFVPAPFVPTMVSRPAASSVPRSTAHRSSPFSTHPRSIAPVGVFSQAMNDVTNFPPNPLSDATLPPENPVEIFPQSMYGSSNTPSHIQIVDNRPPSFLASLMRPSVQAPTVSPVHSQALRPSSQYSEAADQDPRSRRLANPADTSGSQVPRFDLGVMSLPGVSGQGEFSQRSPHYAVPTAATTHLEPVRQGFATLPHGSRPQLPSVATLSAFLGHRVPAATSPVLGGTIDRSVPFLHPRNPQPQAPTAANLEGPAAVLRAELESDLYESSTEDEEETEEERKARILAKLAPQGQRKIAKPRSRKPAP
ncbi:hypothetical protein MMC26_003515 [Xylographa opegraphella]|nr:hypothetical protein [Xylographa opegraphella]